MRQTSLRQATNSFGQNMGGVRPDAPSLFDPENPSEPGYYDSLRSGTSLIKEKEVLVAENRQWVFKPRISLELLYDSNIYISPSDPVSDLSYNITPGFTLGFGDYETQMKNFLLLDYAANFVLFQENSGNNTVNHDARFNFGYRTDKLALGLALGYLRLTSPNADVGTRTTQSIYDAAILSSYVLSEKTFAELNIFNTVTTTVGYLGSMETTIRPWWNYQYSPKLLLGTGVSVGQLDAEESPRQIYEQPLVRFKFEATPKITLYGDGGVDIRQYGGGGGDRVTPVFSFGTAYRPLHATECRLDAYRKINSSAVLAGLDYTTTGCSLQIQQGYKERYWFILAGGYENVKYSPSESDVDSSRQDDYFFIRPSFRAAFGKASSLNLFYWYQKDSSNSSDYGFTDSQVGIQVNLQY